MVLCKKVVPVVSVLCVLQLKFTYGEAYQQPSSLQGYHDTQHLYNTGSADQSPMHGSHRFGFIYTNPNDPTGDKIDRRFNWFKFFTKKKKKVKPSPKQPIPCRIPYVTWYKKPSYHYHDDEDEEEYIGYHIPRYEYWKRNQLATAKRNYQVHEDNLQEKQYQGETPTFRGVNSNLTPPFRSLNNANSYLRATKIKPRRPWGQHTPWRVAKPGTPPFSYTLMEPTPGVFSGAPPQPSMLKSTKIKSHLLVDSSVLKQEEGHNEEYGVTNPKDSVLSYLRYYKWKALPTTLHPHKLNTTFEENGAQRQDMLHNYGGVQGSKYFFIENVKNASTNPYNQPDFSRFGTYDFKDSTFSENPHNYKSQAYEDFNSKIIVLPQTNGHLPSRQASKAQQTNETLEHVVTITPTPIWANSIVFDDSQAKRNQFGGFYGSSRTNKTKRDYVQQNNFLLRDGSTSNGKTSQQGQSNWGVVAEKYDSDIDATTKYGSDLDAATI